VDWFVALVMVVPAFALYSQRSSWLIDYLVWITVLNRGIRRYVDWAGGAFNVFSPISLTPLVVSGLLFLMVIKNYGSFPPHFRRILNFFGVALTLAFLVGIVRNQLAAVYALAEYLAPISIMGCAVMAGGNERLLDRWIKTIGWAAIVASAYGWYQYYTIPPWDAFWVRAVGFEGYLGKLKPTEMTVFSTMAERGPLAGFLAFAVIPMLVSRRWRNSGGWFSVVFIIATILLTYVRSSIITIGMAAILFPVLNKGRNTVQIMLLLAVVAVAANLGFSSIPSSNQIGARMGSIGSITEDGSFKGRIDIARYGLSAVLGNPLGTGLGSTGLAGRVNTGEIEAQASIGDNGYFAILFSLGWIGAGAFFYAFYLIWRQARIFEKMGVKNESLMMFKTLFVTGAVALIAGDWLSGPSSVVFCIFSGFAVNPAASLRALRERAGAKNHPAAN